MRALSQIAALVLAAVAAAGCYESPVPLDAAAQVDLDPGVIGAWRCLGSNSSSTDGPANLTVRRVQDRMFAVTLQEGSLPPDRYEAHTSLVKGRPIVNLRDLSSTRGKPWMFVRYSLLRPNVLQIQVVSADSLKGVEASAPALRKSIERLSGRASLYMDSCVCVRLKTE